MFARRCSLAFEVLGRVAEVRARAPATVTGWVTLTGPDSFQLSDTGGTIFTGTVQADGRFVANAVFGPDAAGQTYTQRLEGVVRVELIHRRALGHRSTQELRIHSKLDGEPAAMTAAAAIDSMS